MIRFEKVVFMREYRRILDGVSFTIDFTERVAVLGGSGEGKTTLLKLLTGLEIPSDGFIAIDGEVLGDRSEDELQMIRRNFGVVFQDGALFDSLSVGENVAFPLRESGVNDSGILETEVRRLLRMIGIEEAIERMPSELSGGMRRRVSIARALATEQARMFLYDEPTADLDPVNAAIIRDIIIDLSARGSGFIMVTHSVLDALLTAQRFLFIDKGHLVIDGGEDALRSSTNPTVRKFMEYAA